MKKNLWKTILTVMLSLSIAPCSFATEVGQTGDTVVNLSIPEIAYTMEIPATTNINASGDATKLTNGLVIKDGAVPASKVVVVTATSKNSWKLQEKTDTTKTIDYGLFEDELGKTAVSEWKYTSSEANVATTGTTKDIWAVPVYADVFVASSGDYTDTITFTAIVRPLYEDFMVLQSDDGVIKMVVDISGCTTWDEIRQKEANKRIHSYYIIDNDSGSTTGYYIFDGTTNQKVTGGTYYPERSYYVKWST
jgi:hypothetical protein